MQNRRKIIPEKGSFSSLQIKIFLEIAIILFVILATITLSSYSFFFGMISSINVTTLDNVTDAIDKLDFRSSTTNRELEKLSTKYDINIEIYSKNDNGDYIRPVYIQYTHSLHHIYNADDQLTLKQTHRPIVDYKRNGMDVTKEFRNGRKIGTLVNELSGERFYTQTCQSSDGQYLYVTAINYLSLQAQASAANSALIILIFIIFIIICAVAYFYIIGITKPLKMINEVTFKMATEGDKSLRIPDRIGRFATEIDNTIYNINSMYDALIITQEQLESRSEMLAKELEHQEEEQQLQDNFIANASHELKTPIAIIQGYVEGIKYLGDDKDALNEYCDIVIDECGKMTNLIISMMTLSNIHQHMDKVNEERFPIYDFLKERILAHEKIFEKQGIATSFEIDKNIYGLADTYRLGYVVNNLLSNAISYISESNKLIRIRYEEIDDSYRIFVYNSGNHIPEEIFKQLWLSFYRNDEARVRSNGHFGLGLAVVKSVQNAHGQKCGVENVDGGVEFWFDIKKG